MNVELVKEMERGFRAAFVHKESKSDVAFRPQFVYNNEKEGQKVLSVIEDELNDCDSFFISVAFVTMGGLQPLLQVLDELRKKGIKGRILTTNYLNFSEPRALTKLMEYPNIDLKMYWARENEGFHTKGYVFIKDKLYKIVVGSSNLTQTALSRNEEWNTKLVSAAEGEYAINLKNRFEELWNSKLALEYDEFIESYTNAYKISKSYRNKLADNKEIKIDAIKFQPNIMQQEFIKNLGKLVSEGENKALLISATGTGKTYASAFAVDAKKYKKMLFLVHREQIAKQAMDSYKKVFFNTRKFGLVSGTNKEWDADFIFGTIQTFSKDENLKRYNQDEFEIIVMDEVHRAGAPTYKKVMEYFKPKLWLGMTASPDRTDGFDIYDLFNHNIAHEIRLEEALKEDLLCPFHYYGIAEFISDGKVFKEDELKLFQYLIEDKRVDYIIEKLNYYGYSGNRVKGLIFCSRKKEAKGLSDAFNKRGYNTVSLSGDDSQEHREKMIERLTSDKIEDKLDYIFSVDIFNEGVDIPEVNQVVMLRPTESPIIFIQQLGRGLRKFNDKEYVVIIDFIGNYLGNNFFIPIALSGDRSGNKDTIRRTVAEGNRVIPGASTIHFDEVSKKRIYASIDNANFSDIKRIKEAYFNLKFKLGRIPDIADFEKHGTIDIMNIVYANNIGSYHAFLKKYDKKDYKIELSELEEKFINFISLKFMSGKRLHELIMLKLMMEHDDKLIERTEADLSKELISFRKNTRRHLINIMTNVWFQVGSASKTFEECVFIKENGNDYSISDVFKKMLSNEAFRNMLKEIIEFGIDRFDKNNRVSEETGLVLYQQYTYEDVCRMLEWTKNEVSLNIGGYKFDAATNTYPVFINYIKNDDESATNYEDRFLNNRELISISKNKRDLSSPDIKSFINSTENKTSVELFVRKNKKEKGAQSFYYLGQMEIVENGYKEITRVSGDGNNHNVVEMHWQLKTPVRNDIFDYITKADIEGEE